MAERIERKDIISDDAAEVFVKLAEDITRSTEAMTKLIKTAQSLNKDLGGAKDLDAFNKATKEAATATEKLSVEQKEYEKVLKAIEVQKAKLAMAQSEEVKQLNELRKKTKEMSDAVKVEKDSIADLARQNKELTKQRNQLSTATEGGRAKIAAINKQIDENTAKIRANSTATEKQRMNIGNYKSALEGLPGPLGNIASSASRMGKQLLVALGNPVVLAITAVVGAVVSLYKAFKSTDEGATFLEAKMKQLNTAWSVYLQTVRGANGDKSGIQHMKEATAAARDYTYAMDALNDAIVANLSEEKKLEFQIARLESIAQDRTRSDADRANALQESLDLEKRLLNMRQGYAKQAYDEELKLMAAKYNVDVKLLDRFTQADAETAANMLKIDKEIARARNSGEEDFKKLEELYVKKYELDRQFEENTKRSVGRLSGLYKQMDEEKKKGTEENIKAKQKEVADFKKAEDEELKMLAAANAEWEDAVWSQIEIEEAAKQEARDREVEAVEDHQKELTKVTDEAAKEREKKEREAADRRAVIQQESFDTIINGFNTLSALYETNKQKELSAAGDNAEKREQIERKYLRKQQALAISETLMRAAQAAVITYKNTGGFPLAIPFLLAQAAFTALQIRTIRAQKFFKGTDYAPEGLAWVGEQGRELVVDPSGQMTMTPNKATLTYLRRGTKVITNRETEKILSDKDYTPLLKEIANKPVTSVVIDSSGINVMTMKGRTSERRIDKYFRT